MITIEQIKELLAFATPGEWTSDRYHVQSSIPFDAPVPQIDKGLTVGVAWVEQTLRVVSDFEEKAIRFNVAESRVMQDAKLMGKVKEIAQLCLSQAEEIERLKLTIRGKTFTE